ncbi:MAG: C40 family peptidase [Bacteroidales bacterium]|nr:C40 family peptidase [Bacteroidales bacterium]
MNAGHPNLTLMVHLKNLFLGMALLLSCSFARSQEVMQPVPVQSAPAVREAVVGVSAAYLRAAADYESALETQELMGTVVKVLETDRYWCKVESPQPYTAWCTDRTLVVMTADEIAAYKAAPKYVCIAPISRVLEKPAKGAAQLCDVVLCDRLRVVFRECGKGSQSDGQATGCRSKDARPLTKGKFAAVLLPDGRQGWMPKDELMDEKEWLAQGADLRKTEFRTLAPESTAMPEKVADADRVRASLASYAKGFLGTPYLWGGMTPKGFDCSGLVRMVYLRYGIFLPRNASQMARLGREIPLAEARPGDLLFFGLNGRVTHIGMYIGDNHFIHSSHLVRINAVGYDAPDAYENWYKFLFCRNILD